MTKFNKWMEYIFTGIFIVYVVSCILTSAEFEWDYGGTLMVIMTVYNLHNEKMEKLAEIEDRLFTLQHSKNKETINEVN